MAAAREKLRTDEISHLVVMDGKRLAGVISEKDLNGAGDDKPVEIAVAARPPAGDAGKGKASAS